MSFVWNYTRSLGAAVVMLTMCAAGAAPGSSQDGVWQAANSAEIATRGERYIRPASFAVASVDDASLVSVLGKAPHEALGGAGARLFLPMPDGSFEEFEIFESPIMAPELAKKFPEIRTYAGRGITDEVAWVRLDRTHLGFHAMIRGSQGTVYIDPYQVENGRAVGAEYMSYFTHHHRRTNDREYSCGFHQADPLKDAMPTASPVPGANRTPTGPQLRTYDLAVATTGEYTSFHGGTVPDGQAAVVTAINRVTGIYQAELAIRLILIPNNDQLIFTNAATDPYTNNNGVVMLGQNQSVVDSIIGSGNYDIGHVFSTGGGGIAGLGVVCAGGQKGRGVTGLNAPIGDPFYVDFVAHEIGHQFGANHTFNGTASSCGGGNRNGSTAYEPGSGSTIMAYAGICGSHNIASASDDHFHTASFDEIVSFVTQGFGSVCDTVTNTGNSAPLVEAGTGFTVPAETPLRLTGSASDPDLDPLVYRWEQFDLGPGGAPQSPTGNAPLFRSFSATDAPVRYLPRLNDILNDTSSLGEVVPDYSRNIRFRLTALDQNPGGGGVDYDVVTHTVTDTSGPFRVTSQPVAVLWSPGTQETITWDVANTDQAPVSCSSVNILLSTNLGQSFTTPLAIFTPNDGSESIIVPDVQTNNGRVSVECADNIFLDINKANIIIEEAQDPNYALIVPPEPLAVCAPDNGTLDVTVTSIGGFSGPVTLGVNGLPAGLTSGFSPNPVNAGGQSTLTIGNSAGGAPGTYPLTITGSASVGNNSAPLTLNLLAGAPSAFDLQTPADGAEGQARNPVLTWAPSTGATSYLVEIATDSGFGNVVYSSEEATTSHEVSELLNFSTTYFWRVTALNDCGSIVSATSSFMTAEAPVTVCNFPFAGIPDNGAPLSDSLTISNPGSVVDIDVFLDVSHPSIADLVIDLTSDTSGTTVNLIDRPGFPEFGAGCTFPNISATIDDEAAEAAEELCGSPPPAIGGSARPNGSLSDFDGQLAAGSWTLDAQDVVAGDSGDLVTWCVTITLGPEVADSDGDGVADNADNCIDVSNPDQRDTNGDGFGNVCDTDLNNDNITNAIDLGIFRSVFFTGDGDADFNGDGIVNALDLGTLRVFFFQPPGPSGLAP